LLGCLVAWLLGCLVAWLLGCLVAWLLGSLVPWFLGSLVAWLLGCLVAWLLGCLASWLLGLAAGLGCWAWLLGLAAGLGCLAWLGLAVSMKFVAFPVSRCVRSSIPMLGPLTSVTVRCHWSPLVCGAPILNTHVMGVRSKFRAFSCSWFETSVPLPDEWRVSEVHDRKQSREHAGRLSTVSRPHPTHSVTYLPHRHEAWVSCSRRMHARGRVRAAARL